MGGKKKEVKGSKKSFLFQDIIKNIYGFSVKEFNPHNQKNQDILNKIESAMIKVCNEVKKKPIIRLRPNEVGNDMEPFVIKALKKVGMNADKPKTTDDKKKQMGYPDVKIAIDKTTIIYLEVKTYAAKNYNTSQRSFYLSPSETPKITTDAFHLLVGFEMERNGDSFTPKAFDIVDLYNLKCDKKTEYNSDNKRLYKKRLVYKKLP